MVQKEGFHCFINPLIESEDLKNLEGQYVTVALNNGYNYNGVLLIVYDDTIVLMDKISGRMKVRRENLLCVYSRAIPYSQRRKEDDKDGKI